jgi:hypothetical protein
MKFLSIFFTSILLLTSQLIAIDAVEQDSNVSIKTFNIDNEQELYNSIKRVFFSSEHEHILDTNWTGLHISKRVTTGFIDIDVEVQSVVISSKTLDTNDTKELSLEIYTTQNDEVTIFKPDNFLHTLFWNRLEYILGIKDEWINCNYKLEAMLYRNHILCNVDKDKARAKEEVIEVKIAEENNEEKEPQ